MFRNLFWNVPNKIDIFLAVFEAYHDKYYLKDFKMLFSDTYLGKN